jgi:hypothetical protein
MNRSILIVICDFLLVSLLAFSTVDMESVVEDKADRQVKLDLKVNPTENRQELNGVMKLALEDERRARELLVGELTQARETAGKQQSLLSEREQQLAERNRQLQSVQQNLQSKEQQARQTAEERNLLQQQMSVAQASLTNLQTQLRAASTETLVSQEKLALLEAELRKQQDQAAALARQLSQLEQSNQLALAEKQQLFTQLQVNEVEKRSATQQVARMEEEVKVERQEKAILTAHANKLADGVKALATKSGEIVQEMRENRPLAPNTVFNEFVTNRVHARFNAFRAGLLGFDHTRQRETETVLVSDGTNYYALCHAADTAVMPANPAPEWESLTGTLGHNTALLSITAMRFALADPRVILIPLTEGQARDLGSKVYRLAPDPFKFQEAVLVGARENYYGECKFQIDLSTPQYVKMDHNFFYGLFGKFNPSRGDLVFSKTGELLGIMVNNTYCLRLSNFTPVATLQFGTDVRAQHTGEILSRLYSLILQLPLKLQ